MIEGVILAIALGSLVGSVRYVVRHERARRAAARFVFPPIRTIETRDEIPF